MPEFLQLTSPTDALQRMLTQMRESAPPAVPSETVMLSQALGRVTAEAVCAPHPLPPFTRSAVDGYAVRSPDTYGASESLPAYLSCVGEVPMGAVPSFDLEPGQCALIHTGGMLPAAADAVVMLEHAQAARPGEVEILRAVATGENVIRQGEDVLPGQEVIPAGTRLRPAEIGGLAALGITHLRVARRPRVGILSTGDEVVPPDATPKPGQVRDVNTPTLTALIEQAGGQPIQYGIIPDRPESLLQAARQAFDECDAVLITAGSSVSMRDLTSQIIQQLGAPGVLVHGISIRPGKPTILAVCNGRPVIGLPGNPVSALVIAQLFVVPVIEWLLGLKASRPRPTVTAHLTGSIPSQAGREDWAPVKVITTPQGYQAEPVFGKSNLIFTLVRADGLVRIPAEATGLEAGTLVEVLLQ